MKSRFSHDLAFHDFRFCCIKVSRSGGVGAGGEYLGVRGHHQPYQGDSPHL